MSFWRKAPKTDRALFTWSVACLVFTIFMLGLRDNALRAKPSDDEEFLRFIDVAAEVYNEIKGKYVDEKESREVLEGALAGMFARLDEHSQYMDPGMLDSLNKDTGGEFSGIGIHITMRQGLLTVIAPIPGSPSAQLGIMPWDRIIEIEGETTEGMTLQNAVERLTGPAGTKVKIKVYREGEMEPLEFAITRANIKVDSVHYRMTEDRIGYLRIARFSENTAADMRKALLDLKKQGMDGLILDLRFNTGGLLREAIEVSDLFVPKHEMIVSTKGRLKSQNREYRASEEPIVEVPTFVLVNEGSASASEIVAGALQDHHLAVVLGPSGKNTFGKGSVQTIEPLRHSLYDDDSGNPKESAIRLTTARYYVPSGKTIHHVGIKPDIGVQLPKGHEVELLRRGLFGDTTIPLTANEEIEEEETETPDSIQGLIIQNQAIIDSSDETETEEPAESAPSNVPFYSNAKKPELKEDTFVDLMLEEAMKQMKIYMILKKTAKEGEPRMAEAIESSGLSLSR